jgi:RNase P protein component
MLPLIKTRYSSFSNYPNLTANGVLDVFQNSVIFTSPIKYCANPSIPERTKSDISGFSPQARMRMMRMFSKVDYERYSSPLFVSTTFHNDWRLERIFLKKTLDNFLKRLKRQLPEFHHIWKLELQKRDAPHFHFMILFLQKFSKNNFPEFEKIIKKNWDELKFCNCEYCQIYSVKTKPVYTYKHAMIYISKELGKVSQNNFKCDIGNYWNHSRQIFIKKYETIDLTISEMHQIINSFLSDHPDYIKNEEFKNKILNEPYSFSLFININDISPYLIKFLKERNHSFSFKEKFGMNKYQLNKILIQEN